MAGAANVMIKIGANASQAVSEIQKVNGALGDQMTKSQKASFAIKKAAVPAAIALTALAGAAISAAKAAAEDEEAQVKLAGSLRRTAGASEAAIAGAEAYIEKLSLATGVADDQLRPALAKLATVTGDVASAQDALAVALDVSAATGKDVDSVSKALAKAYAGSGASLGKLIPGLNKAAIESGDFAKINKELARVTGGAAAESANTAAGQFRRFQLTIDETKEQIGAAFLPVLDRLAPILLKVAKFVKDNTDAVVALGAVIATLAAGILVANAALKVYESLNLAVKVATTAWTAAQWLLNAALTANPIGLVVIAIAALVAGLILAYQKSETFRNIVDTVWEKLRGFITSALRPLIENWDTISDKIQTVIGKVREFWPLLVPGGALYIGIKTIEDRFGVFSTAIDAVKNAFQNAREAAGNLLNRLGDLWDKARDVMANLRGIISSTLEPLRAKFDAIRAVVERVVDAIGKLGGGILNRIPGIGGRSVTLSDSPLARSALAPVSTTVVNLTVNGPVDSDSTARELLRVLDQYDRRYGVVVA